MNDDMINDTEQTKEPVAQGPDKQYLFGRNILLFLVGAETLFGIYNYLYDHTFLSFTVVVCLLIALFYGGTFLRTLFSALYILIGIGCLLEAIRLYQQPTIHWLIVSLFAVQFLYSIGAGALLFFHPSVKKYLYMKRRV